MEQQGRIVALFDFDGTLSKGHFWTMVAKHHIKRRMKLPQLSMYFVTHISLWLASKFRILSKEAYKVKWGEDLAIAFKGFNRRKGLQIFRRIDRRYVFQSLRPDIMALLQQHRSQGHIIILLSGAFTDFLETLKDKLGADYVVGTRLEVRNDRYTGRIVRPLCYGANKARLLKEFLDQTRLNIDLGFSFAYADSIVDAPVLEMVGNPVATYPDRELSRLACLRGWRVLPHPADQP
jgi:HAD superfamily hydrolase (TIGR01490 family)